MPAIRNRETQSLSLDVTMDAQLPALTIISPTPRAFTFPATHNLDGSPSPSPSNSPFEPEAYPFGRIRTPPPPLARLSPESIAIASPSSSSIHKRRKSSTSSVSVPSSHGDVVERRPKKGDEDYIKRPENAFILFRRKCCEDRQAAALVHDESSDVPAKKQRQADLSKAISQQWKGLSAEERQYWEELAKEKKKEHEQMYPNYVYRPQRAKDKDGRSKSRKPAKTAVKKGSISIAAEVDQETDSESIKFALPLRYPHQSSRSHSVPTPPPQHYQMIGVPNVFTSCPTSPTLPTVPVRSGSESAWSTFDYMPAAYGQTAPFDASLQSSEPLYHLPQQPYHQQHDLGRLTMPHESILPQHVISPISSSGSSSPISSPYTPATLLTQSFPHLSTSTTPASSVVSTPQTQAEIDLQMEFASYSWDNNSLWPSNGTELQGNDFDINSIPTAQLDMAKFNAEGFDSLGVDLGAGMNMGVNVAAMEYAGHAVHAPNVEGLMAFDDMMTGHAFH